MTGLFTRIKNWVLGGVWQPDPEMRRQIPFTNFPRTLEGFGYYFNEDGELRDIKTGERFNFVARENDHYYNQKRYEAVGDVVTEYVDNIMITKHKLKKVTVPIDAKKGEASSYFFMSEDAMTNPRLLILIHGSGAVRAGQWSRKLIINENIRTGSQLPYIERGLAAGYGIIITNTNLNTVTCNRQQVSIRDNENAENHGNYVWEHFVAKSAARDIAIVAHSYGGIVTVFTGTKYPKDFHRRVFAIAFTDSVHGYTSSRVHPVINKLLVERAVNYVSASSPLGSPMERTEGEDCPAVSAGTTVHELTSWKSIDLVFRFIEDRYSSWVKEPDREAVTAQLAVELQAQGFVAASDPSMEWAPDDSLLLEKGIITPDEKCQEKTEKKPAKETEEKIKKTAEEAEKNPAKEAEEKVKKTAEEAEKKAVKEAEEKVKKTAEEAEKKAAKEVEEKIKKTAEEAEKKAAGGAEEPAKEPVETQVEVAVEKTPVETVVAGGAGLEQEAQAGAETMRESSNTPADAVDRPSERPGEVTPADPAEKGEATGNVPSAEGGEVKRGTDKKDEL